jgi:hypothetical protein
MTNSHLARLSSSGTQDQIFITVRQLGVCWCGVPFLTRGWVCRLQLLLALSRAVILGFESCRCHDHILLSQIWDCPSLEGQVPIFISPKNRVAQLYPQALGSFNHLVLLITSWYGPCRKHRFPPLLHCCVCVCWNGHMIVTEPLPSNDHCLQSRSLATALFTGFTILPGANMPQYYCVCVGKSQCFLAYFPY